MRARVSPNSEAYSFLRSILLGSRVLGSSGTQTSTFTIAELDGAAHERHASFRRPKVVLNYQLLRNADFAGAKSSVFWLKRQLLPSQNSTLLRTKDMPPPPADKTGREGKFRPVVEDKNGLVQVPNPFGHLWRDKWTALSGPLSESKRGVVSRRASPSL